MAPPAPRALQKRLKIPLGVSEAAALEACEEACSSVGFAAVAKAEGYIVCLPLPSQSLLSCIAPVRAVPVLQERKCGHGICAQIVPSVTDEGRMAISIAGDRNRKGKEFIAELRARLRACAHRASMTGASDAASAALPAKKERADPVITMAMRADSAGYFATSKVLCDHMQGSPGASANIFLKDFSDRWAHQNGSATPADATPMADIMNAAHEISTLLGIVVKKPITVHAKSLAAEIARPAAVQPNLRLQVAVERYLFARAGTVIWQHYVRQHEESDAKFTEKLHALESVPDTRLLDELKVRPDLHGRTLAGAEELNPFADDVLAKERTDSTSDNDENEDVERSEDVHEVASDLTQPSNANFSRASAALLRVEALLSGGTGSTPWEAIEALAIAHCELRACAWEASSGKADLGSTDDMLPVFVFILVRSSLQHPAACAQLMSDALQSDEKLDEEGKIVTLLASAATYVAQSWDISGLC